MGLTQTKLHFKILKGKWPDVVTRVGTPKGVAEARTQNPYGDLPLHTACYTGRAPPHVIRALLVAYMEGAAKKNKGGFLPLELAELNYRRGSRYRDEVLGALRAAADMAAARAAANSSPFDADEIQSGGIVLLPDEVYRTSDTCVVCLDNPATEVVVPCGHLCLCSDCSLRVRERRVCPVGRCFVGNIVYAGASAAASRSDGAESCGCGESFVPDERRNEQTGTVAAAAAAMPAC